MASDGRPPRRLNRAETKQQTRDRLIAATAEVVARHGVAGASVNEIAETAGYTVGALYSQFGSKDNLVVEAMHHYVERGVEEAGTAMGRGSIDDEENRAALSRLITSPVSDELMLEPLFWVELWLHAARNPELADLLAQVARSVDSVIERSIHHRRADAEAGGAPPVGPHPEEVSDDTMATIVSSLYRGLAQRRRIDPTAVPDELLGQALRLLVAGRRALHPREGAGASPEADTETAP